MGVPEGLRRRAGVRYIVVGEVIFHTGSPDSCGELVNIGQRGILVRTNLQAPQGAEFRMGVTVDGYPQPLQARAEVVGSHENLLALKFVTEPAEMTQLLHWLLRENVPWTGLDSQDATPPGLSAAASYDENRNSPAANQDLDAILPFIEAMG
jgi:hypothetical protein